MWDTILNLIGAPNKKVGTSAQADGFMQIIDGVQQQGDGRQNSFMQPQQSPLQSQLQSGDGIAQFGQESGMNGIIDPNNPDANKLKTHRGKDDNGQALGLLGLFGF